MTSRTNYYKTISYTYNYPDPHTQPNIELKIELPTTTKENFSIEFGKDNNADPKIWGPPFWFTLHNGANSYPVHASPLYIERMKNFILAIPIMLPCTTCKEHATNFIEKNKDLLDFICSGRDTLCKFFIDFHNSVNARYNKKIYSYAEVYELYNLKEKL